MRIGPRRLTWFDRRLAWRLCLLFVAGALLPVALSDWLVISVVGDVADRLNQERRADAARVASRQVLDRLKIAESLLQSFVVTRPRDGGGAPAAMAFEKVDCWQRGDADSPLRRQWQEVAAHLALRPPVQAQIALTPGDPARVLLGVNSAEGASCAALLSADYLWAPLHNAADDTSWRVRDGAGRVLAATRGEDADLLDQQGLPREDFIARLFMAGEFGAPDWTFVQSAPRARVDWHHAPVISWLAAVASATLLAVGLFGQWRIRRTLRPLELLTAGTRRIAQGEASTRVEVRRDDELGELATAFNEMATQLQAREQELVRRAVHDDLTGLTNRYGLHQALDRLLERRRGAAGPAVLFIDLDGFKDVNDRHGHAVGDRVLQLAADRLRAIAGDGMLLARKGGDEFVVVVPDGDAALVCEIAARIVAALAAPFRLPGAEHACGASVGIALCPAHGDRREELMRCADIALYQSKNTGRGRFTLFDPALDAALRERAELHEALRGALERDEFVLHYQPRLGALDGRIGSAEALVRWERPGHGLVLPGVFIELAESSGLIVQIGQRVLDRALAQVARWRAEGLGLERVSVNVSPRQLAAGDFVERVRRSLQRHGVDGRWVELEVTESLLSGDVASVRAQLQQLRALGVSVAMDDFGTGYSSMSLLRTLPIDVMKIDRAFVCDLETDPNAVAIARTIVTLGQSLSLTLVAEGIETPGQAALLRAMGCHELQGFLFCKAVPPEDFAALPGLRRGS
jgi:diguanylate cyclase (GGDEF)-like protein